jgi:hypothetical protein
MEVFACVECNKQFTSRQSMNYHINNRVCHKDDGFICNFCNKELSSAPSLSRHKTKSCKEMKKIKERKELSEEIYAEMEDKFGISKIYDLLVKMYEDGGVQARVTRPEKASTINNVTNNNCNINNGTVNNIYLVGCGKEDMAKIDYNDLLKGIKMGFNSTLNLIDTVHFNPKYPEFHNVYISSMKNKYAMMYDGNAWTLVMKDDLIDKMYDDKRNYIEENLDEFIDSLSNGQRNALYRWMDADEDHMYVKKIKNDIKLLLYNKRKLPLNHKNKMIKYLDRDDIRVVKELKMDIDVDDITDVDEVIDISDVNTIEDVNTDEKPVRKRSRLPKTAGRPGTKRKVIRVGRI